MWPDGSLAGVMDGRITLGLYMVCNLHACIMIVALFPSLGGIFYFNAVARLPFFAAKYSFGFAFSCDMVVSILFKQQLDVCINACGKTL